MNTPPLFVRTALCLAMITSLGAVPLAQAELMLNPTRVVLAANQRAAQVELINDGSEPASYRISIVNRRMSETGEFVTIDAPGPGELFAGSMLVYSPRQITLQPRTAQVVRLMVRRPEGLADGEYRSHLHFEKLPDPTEHANSVDSAGKNAANIGVVLRTLIGASIPVIVRQGPAQASVTLTQLDLQPGAPNKLPQLSFRIERAGNSSVYGDLAAAFIPAGGTKRVLAKASGVAVYTPNASRRAALPFMLPVGATLGRGQLRLTYHERAEAGGKLLAEAVLTLP